MIAVLTAQALFLAAAGLAKLARPGPTSTALRAARLPSVSASPYAVRVFAVAEVAVAAAVVTVGGRLAVALFAATFTVLAVVAARIAITQPGADCGCFGAVRAPAGHWHTMVNASCALTGLAALPTNPTGLVEELRRQPLAGAPLVGGILVLACLYYACVTALPELTAARAAVTGAR